MGVPGLLAKMHALRLNDRLGPSEVRAVREHRFRRMLRHAARHSPFYAEHYRGLDLDRVRLQDLPPVDKADLRANFDRMVTDPALRRDDLMEFVNDRANIGRLYNDRYVCLHTSGTTGEPIVSVTHQRDFEWIPASVLARNRSLPLNPVALARYALTDPGRIAAVVVNDGLYPAYSPFLFQRDSRMVEVRDWSIFRPADELVAEVDAFRPTMLVTYPTMLEVFARARIEGRMRWDFDHPTASIVSVSEPLEERTRRLVRRAWGLEVINTYGLGECLGVARGCGVGEQMHVHSELAALEVMDERDEPAAPGVEGHHAYVTNLFNRTLPLLRYRVPDRITMAAERCPCGSPHPGIAQVAGRTDDLFWVRRTDGGWEALHPYVFLATLVEMHEIRNYQVIQDRADHIDIRIERHPEVDADAVEAMVRERFREIGLEGRFGWEIHLVDRIERDPRSGKIRRMWNRFGTPEEAHASAAV